MTTPAKVGYIVKRYPRFSETFIVNEILAHEAAGIALEIFSLRPPEDTHFQDSIARVRAPVHYLEGENLKALDFWECVEDALAVIPDLWTRFDVTRGEEARDVCAAAQIAAVVRRNGIRHLHAHFASSPANVARMAARLAGVPYTFTAHAKDIFHDEVEPDDLRRKLADAKACVTVSDYNVQFLRKNFDARNVVRVYNGLDLDRFRFSQQKREPLVLGIGRLVEKKGFDVLIEACARLPYECQIIGSGELEAELRAKLSGRITMPGPLPQSDVIELMHRAAVVAAPCVIGEDGNRDGMPTVLLEAMALGTPCVATDVTGIPELVRDGETGLIVPQHNAEALAAAIDRLVKDPGQIPERARKLIEQECDAHHNAAKIRKIWEL